MEPTWTHSGIMEPRIAELLARSERRLDVCVAFALLWIAAADGALDVKTHAYLNRHFETIADGLENSDALLAIIAAGDVDSFLMVCRVLQRELREEEKEFFLKLAVGAAAAKGPLPISDNHILRLYADLLGFGAEGLSDLYRQHTGEELPEPGDPSSVLWWEVREHRRASSGAESKHHAHDQSSANSGNFQSPPPGRGLSRAEAYAILGLEKEAPRTEIKRAYRRLVQNYHPDRYEGRDLEARQAAEHKFLRVQQAYEVLSP